MLRKLLFSVLVLSLFLAFAGTAFSDTRKPVRELETRSLPALKTNQELVVKTIDRPQNAKTFEITQVGVDMPYPTPYAPDHECEVLDHADYGAANVYYTFDMVGVIDGGLHISNRFEVQQFHSAEVNGAAIRIYDMSANALDIVLHVWDDAGGIPGAYLGGEIIPAASVLANGAGHWLFSIPTVAIPGAYYHISYETVGASEDDYITFGIYQNPDGTDHGMSNASVDGGANWMTLTALFGGFPLNARLSADVCYLYNDCYWDGGPDFQFIIPMPLEGYTEGAWTGYGQRFEAINDTLKTVEIILYVHPATQVYVGSGETNGITINVWDDDGFGNIDLAAGPLATRSIAGGVANMFPVTTESRDGPNGNWLEFHDFDVSAEELVFKGYYHVTINMTSSAEADGQIWALVGDYGAGGSVAYDTDDGTFASTETSPSWLTEIWGNGAAFYMDMELCRDEYQECVYQKLYNAPDWGDSWRMASYTEGVTNYVTAAQSVKGRDYNRVEHARFMVANNYWYDAVAEVGDMGVKFIIWNETIDPYGDKVPGSVLWESAVDHITDADARWNAWGELWVDVVIPDVLTNGDYWVGFEVINEGGLWLRAVNDGGWGSGKINSGSWLFYLPWDEWISTGLFGVTDDYNWWIAVDQCSVPMPEYACGVADWGTLQGNYQRTGHALVGIGDAQCNLTLEWAYVHPTGKYGQYTGPIIVDNTIVATFRSDAGTEYKTFDLITKAEGYTITTGGNVTGNATVDNGIMYMAGGANSSADIVIAVNFANGAPLFTISTTGPLGTALGMGAGENNVYGNFIVEEGVLFFSTDIGKVYACDAVTGAAVWDGPFVPTGFGSVSNRTGTSDGNGTLFYGYAAVVGGDIIALDALDGTQIWSLAAANGLEGNDAYGGGVAIEQFSAGIAYDAADGYLYAVSTCAGDHPIAGVLYQISAGTGTTVNPAVPVNGVSNAVTPVIDVQNVLVPTKSIWNRAINAPFTLQVYRKTDLALVFGTGWGVDGFSAADYMVADMLMTCEFEADDLIFFFSRRGVLHCINGNTGEELFTRRITDQEYGGAAGAIALDTEGAVHLVYQDASSGLYDLTIQSPRARLDLLRGNEAETSARGEVPFGTVSEYPVTFTDMYRNIGCEDLEGVGIITLTSNGGPSIPYKSLVSGFGNNGFDQAQSSGYQSPSKANSWSNAVETPDFDENATYVKPLGLNPAALALGFINDENVTIFAAADGEAVSVVVEVDQVAVGRGVFPRFLSITSHNDPDFWLDGPAADPEIMITFLGGCIMEMTPLAFGYTEANEQIIFNSGRVVENGVGDFTIDGFAAMLFQGMYIFGTSPQAQAWTIVSWLEGSGETSTWNGWLPELIDGQCIPIANTEPVDLGEYSSDGTYPGTTIWGNTVAYNSIDSVQDFTDEDELDGWNHANFIAPFSNELTMGLTIEHLTLGAYTFGFDEANPGAGILDDIGNATIEIFDFKERNGNPIEGWKFACYYDWDVGANDTTNLDRGASLAWTYDARDAGSAVGGSVKLPFNFCGDVADPNYIPPMKLGVTMDQAQGMWGTLGGGGNDVWFLDSMNFYANLPWDSTIYCQDAYVDEDQAGAYVIAEHDFTGGDSYRLAVANFQFQDYGGNNRNPARMIALAHTLNKWMGFGRGDVNNDNVIDMMDIIYTSNYVAGGAGPIPFEYLGDVNLDGNTDLLDVTAIADFYFGTGGCFGGLWTM